MIWVDDDVFVFGLVFMLDWDGFDMDEDAKEGLRLCFSIFALLFIFIKGFLIYLKGYFISMGVLEFFNCVYNLINSLE